MSTSQPSQKSNTRSPYPISSPSDHPGRNSSEATTSPTESAPSPNPIRKPHIKKKHTYLLKRLHHIRASLIVHINRQAQGAELADTLCGRLAENEIQACRVERITGRDVREREESRERRLTTGDTCRKAMLGMLLKRATYLRFSGTRTWRTYIRRHR